MLGGLSSGIATSLPAEDLLRDSEGGQGLLQRRCQAGDTQHMWQRRAGVRTMVQECVQL